MSALGWADVQARYAPGAVLAPLVGSSSLVVDEVDDDRLCVRQRLWRACLTRTELETATAVLAAVLALASATVLKTGIPKTSWPPFPGVTPATTFVPYSCIFCA